MVRTHSADRSDVPQTAASSTSALNLKYEQAVAELEEIVRRMEGDGLSLEESIAAYRRGSELLRHCREQLKDAESKIQVLESGELRDFDNAAGATR